MFYALLNPKILGDHGPANRVIEIPILRKRLKRQVPVHVVQAPEQRPHELHPAHMTQQLRDALVARLVLGRERDVVVRGLEVDVLGGEEVVGGAEEAGALGGEGGVELLDGLEEDEALAAVEGLDVRSGGGERLVCG